jgi:hypothetical protein
MLIFISAALAAAVATSAPIQVESTLARESSNKATGFGKNMDQGLFSPQVKSVSTASISPDGSVEVNCETHRPESNELERNEQPK